LRAADVIKTYAESGQEGWVNREVTEALHAMRASCGAARRRWIATLCDPRGIDQQARDQCHARWRHNLPGCTAVPAHVHAVNRCLSPLNP
jgi:hypothetical protein